MPTRGTCGQCARGIVQAGPICDLCSCSASQLSHRGGNADLRLSGISPVKMPKIAVLPQATGTAMATNAPTGDSNVEVTYCHDQLM